MDHVFTGNRNTQIRTSHDPVSTCNFEDPFDCRTLKSSPRHADLLVC
ncbi:MAG: hypothetical protein AAF649_12915 [Verrucomicrobiota bacterium]